MKKINLVWAAVALAVTAGCAKPRTPGLNDANKAYFDSWLSVYYPAAQETPLGAYVIEDIPGTGELIGDASKSPYVRFNYTITDLKGNVTSTSHRDVAQRVFAGYDEHTAYLPEVWMREGNLLYAGIDESVSQMRVGGRRSVIVPGWLVSKERYATPKEYLDKVEGENAIYHLEAVERISDILKWEIDSVIRFLSKNYPSVSPKDSLMNGFYYIRKKEPKSSASVLKDTVIYINYIGRLLDGTVFDTNIRDTAVRYGLKPTTTDPVQINSNETYTNITMTSDESKIIPGFAYTIAQMHPYERGLSVFVSGYGYSYSGSGVTIPSYSPLIFDIELVDKKI